MRPRWKEREGTCRLAARSWEVGGGAASWGDLSGQGWSLGVAHALGIIIRRHQEPAGPGSNSGVNRTPPGDA